MSQRASPATSSLWCSLRVLGAFAAAPLLSGCDGLREEPVTLPRLVASLDVTADGSMARPDGQKALRLSRTVRVQVAEDGATRIAPVRVQIVGEGDVLQLSYEPGGARSQVSERRKFTGAEGPFQASKAAPFCYFHAVAAFDATGTGRLGYPTTGSAIRTPAGPWVFDAKQQLTGREHDDPALFHLYAPVDLDLAPLLRWVPGSWKVGEARGGPFTMRRDEDLPALAGVARLTYRGLDDQGAVFQVAVEWSGRVWPGDVVWQVRRRADGTLRIGSDGKLGPSQLHAVTEILVKETVAATTEVSADLRVGPATEGGLESAATAFARLDALRRSDPVGFQSALLGDTAATARRLVLEARPKASLNDTKVQIWDGSIDVGALTKDARQVADSPLAIALVQAQGRALVRLGLVTEDDLSRFKDKVPGGGAGVPWAAAMAIPDRGLILVRPEYITDVRTLAHEYAHIASSRFGYADMSLIGLGGEGKIDESWVDVDGLLASWAMEEAEAVVTEEVVLRGARDPAALGLLFGGWARMISDSSSAGDSFEHLLHLLYRQSPGVVTAAHRAGASLEDTLAGAWKGCTYTTRQTLFPGAPGERSAYWPLVRACRGTGPEGGSRAGAFLVREMLSRGAGVPWPEATSLAKTLRDDGILVWRAGALWVTRWDDESSATRFAKLYREFQKGASTTQDHEVILVTSGDVPELPAWRDRLTIRAK